ncbi:MAG TPA: hypothetical protein ENI27_03690 [bacterium]|nr:hypothetical protein [bacterium]
MPRLPRFDPADALKETVALLEEANIDYALVGCLAVWAYVPPGGKRLTDDIDFAVSLKDLEPLLGLLEQHGYLFEPLPAGGFRTEVLGIVVDFIYGGSYLADLFSSAVGSAKVIDYGDGIEVFVTNLDHLITMKVAAGGEQDEFDLRHLLKLIDTNRYKRLRSFVLNHTGYIGMMVLDRMARSISHPGVGPPVRN